jgi:hypothetical protein
VEEIEVKSRRLRAMKRALSTLVDWCVEDASTRECPILEALDDSSA